MLLDGKSLRLLLEAAVPLRAPCGIFVGGRWALMGFTGGGCVFSGGFLADLGGPSSIASCEANLGVSFLFRGLSFSGANTDLILLRSIPSFFGRDCFLKDSTNFDYFSNIMRRFYVILNVLK